MFSFFKFCFKKDDQTLTTNPNQPESVHTIDSMLPAPAFMTDGTPSTRKNKSKTTSNIFPWTPQDIATKDTLTQDETIAKVKRYFGI